MQKVGFVDDFFEETPTQFLQPTAARSRSLSSTATWRSFTLARSTGLR
jgi:hypothetical protein